MVDDRKSSTLEEGEEEEEEDIVKKTYDYEKKTSSRTGIEGARFTSDASSSNKIESTERSQDHVSKSKPTISQYWTLKDVLIILSLTFFIVAGPASDYVMSILLVEFEDEFEINRTYSSSLSAFRSTATFTMQGCLAFCLLKLRPRRWMTMSVLLSCSGMLAASIANDFSVVCLCWGMISGFGGGAAYMIVQAAIPELYPEKVATMTGVIFSGMGIGFTIWASFLKYFADALGWRSALRYGAMLNFVLSVPVFFVSIEFSTSKTRKDAKTVVEEETPQSTKTWSDKKRAFMLKLRERRLVLLFVDILLVVLFSIGIYGHFFAFYEDSSMSNAEIDGILLSIGIANILGRPLFGTIADRVGRYRTLVVIQFMMSVLVATWFLTDSNVIGACVWSFFFSLFTSGFWPVIAGCIFKLTDRRYFSRMFGFASIFVFLPSCMFSPVLFGILRAAFDSYSGPSFICGIGSAIVTIMYSMSLGESESSASKLHPNNAVPKIPFAA